MPWSWLALFLSLASGSAFAGTRDVRIGVLGMFHPRELTLTVCDTDVVVDTPTQQLIFLHPRSPSAILHIRASGDTLLLEVDGKEIHVKEFHATGRDRDATDFVLSVPGQIQRRYRGTLDVKIVSGEVGPEVPPEVLSEVQSIVTMDLESAVASVVYAESLPGASQEALKAQAVVTRSYLVSGKGRHANFDFCDLTHCQVLREAPPRGSPVSIAVAATRGLVVTSDNVPVATMFTRSCSGRTLTPAEIGIPARGYLYFSVVCDFCRKHPVRWSRAVSWPDAVVLSEHHEAARLAVDRRLGWNTVLSNNFTETEDGGQVFLEGVGQGHGVGLCQRGAQAMALAGVDFRAIIAHYFPNTRLGRVTPRAAEPR